ncbi:MAG: GntR family transcriptional regulator [Anaerovoracaceae bacterium]|nr:GntR family transcriptional regulator [Anaerovoracaceae bacterium]
MFQLDLRGNKSIYEQIIDKFKEFIMRGTMKQGEKMPSVRELSKTLGVNPNTIQKAYRELERQGYIYTASGIGTFVADKNTIRPDEDELKKARENIAEAFSQLLLLGLSRDEARAVVYEIMKEKEEDL